MSEDENDTGIGFFSLLKGKGSKSCWWLPFACLFLFLLAGGYYAVTAMRQSAHKLAGGDSYNQLSANSAIYEGKASVPKHDGFFDSEEEPIAAAGNDAAGDRMPPMKPLIDKDGGQSSAAVQEGQQVPAAEGSSGEDADAAARRAPKGQAERGTMSDKLGAMNSFTGSRGGGGSKTSGPGGTAAFEESGAVAAVSSQQNKVRAAAPKRGGGGGVLESLKGAFRASIYGARIASADSAKNWISRSFDATPEAETTIQYEENMRSKLDVVNPNSIPQFLRDQDISAAGAKTLTTSKVSNPGLDKEATAAAAEKDKAEKDDSAASMLSGMMGPMFGSSSLSPDTEAPAADEDERLSLTGTGKNGKAEEEPLLDPVVDEFGYISYGDPNGTQITFDDEGNLMGCTDNKAGMCLMAGAPGCP
ncbi:MAG: hypothetical protein NTY45_16455 [Elusimicrobia bacterium]|nr:hypothetical protein [Elusimicrobiota bacterium]